MKRFLGVLGLGVVFASQAFASVALQPGEFRVTRNEAEARSVHAATVRAGTCQAPAISVDWNGVWLVQCSGPDRNGGDPVPSAE